MPLKSDRFFTHSPSTTSIKSYKILVLCFIIIALTLLLATYLFTQRYMVDHPSSVDTKKKVIVSLSEPYQPMFYRKKIASMSSASNGTFQVSSPISMKAEAFFKVLSQFSLSSSQHILAQIGGNVLPESLYYSSESLKNLFTNLLDTLFPNPSFFKEKEEDIDDSLKTAEKSPALKNILPSLETYTDIWKKLT
jgi:hypothetical protein